MFLEIFIRLALIMPLCGVYLYCIFMLNPRLPIQKQFNELEFWRQVLEEVRNGESRETRFLCSLSRTFKRAWDDPRLKGYINVSVYPYIDSREFIKNCYDVTFSSDYLFNYDTQLSVKIKYIEYRISCLS